MTLMKSLMVGSLSLLLLTGCARSLSEALYIRFPDAPKLTWYFCDPAQEMDDKSSKVLCVTQKDGAALSKWFDKVRAFNHARERLQDYK